MDITVENNRRCGFCGQYECHVQSLIAGPSGYICDACVGKATELLAERPGGNGTPAGEMLSLGVKRDEFAYSVIREHFHPVKMTDIVTASRVFPARMRADLQKALDARLGTKQGHQFFRHPSKLRLRYRHFCGTPSGHRKSCNTGAAPV